MSQCGIVTLPIRSFESKVQLCCFSARLPLWCFAFAFRQIYKLLHISGVLLNREVGKGDVSSRNICWFLSCQKEIVLVHLSGCEKILEEQ